MKQGRFDWPAIALVAILNLVVLSPMLDCGFVGDDLLNSCTQGTLAERGHTAFGWALVQTQAWAQGAGRFFPLSSSYILFFALTNNLLLYRVIGLGMVLGNVALFGRLTARLTASRRLGLLAAALCPALFQFRQFADPILGNCMLLQILWMFLLGSLLAFDRYLETVRRRWLVLAVALYMAATLAYEVAWPLFLLFALVAVLRMPDRKSLRTAARAPCPFVAVAVAFLLLNVGLRWAFQVPLVNRPDVSADRRYLLTLEPGHYGAMLSKHVLAACPLSYRVFCLRDLGWLGQLGGQATSASATFVSPLWSTTMPAKTIQRRNSGRSARCG